MSQDGRGQFMHTVAAHRGLASTIRLPQKELVLGHDLSPSYTDGLLVLVISVQRVS